MRFKLSTLLVVFTFLAIVLGLGYRVHLLQQQVATLNSDIKVLKAQQSGSTHVFYSQPRGPNLNSPFRLLDTDTTVYPSIEIGLKADELQQQRRIEHQLKRDDIRAPQLQVPDLKGRAR